MHTAISVLSDDTRKKQRTVIDTWLRSLKFSDEGLKSLKIPQPVIKACVELQKISADDVSHFSLHGVRPTAELLASLPEC